MLLQSALEPFVDMMIDAGNRIFHDKDRIYISAGIYILSLNLHEGSFDVEIKLFKSKKD